MSKQKTQTTDSAAVPARYARKWLVWDHEETRILAAARTLVEAKAAAEAAGASRPVLVKVPLADVRFVGWPMLFPFRKYRIKRFAVFRGGVLSWRTALMRW